MPIPRILAHVALAGLCLVAPALAAAQEVDESSGLIGLSLPLGARVVGQGRAVVASSGELEAIPYNPATLFGLEGGALAYSRFEAADLAEVNGNYLAGGTVTRWGTFAVHLVYLDYGEIPLTDASPEPIGTIDLNDWAIGVTYAHRWRDKIAYGLTAKYLKVDLGTTDAGGAAIDAGVVYAPRSGLPMTLGASLRNVGRDLDFGDTGDGAVGVSHTEALPGLVRVGLHYHPATFPGLPDDYRITMSFDIESALRELSTSSQHAGMTLTIHDVVVARAGFLLVDNPFTVGSTHRNAGGSIGVGVRLGDFTADLARELSVSELGDETHIGVSWSF